MNILDRYRGAVLGLAAGDALGTTLEFSPPGTFTPIDDMVGGGPFDLEAGQWTDDTSMALCLAESLIESNGFDPVDQLARYVRWKREGHHSSTGRCFDVGGTVRAALARFERHSEPWSGSTDEFSAGNGSIMRLAPVPLFFASDPAIAIARAADSSRTTHGAPEAMDGCRYLAALIIGALQGRAKEELLAPLFTPVRGLWSHEPLAPRIHDVAAGSFLNREPPVIRGSGYVVESLEAALWAFARSTSFRDGALLAVNLGDDADTTGAVYGQLAGAYYGVVGIPDGWRSKLAHLNVLESFSHGLLRVVPIG
ncbi:MAG: ADP-ribosylglycohydrolase family protein [Vicinamibacterales bacterium]